MKMETKSSPQVIGLIQTNLKYQTKEFFHNSTLHGVRYIAEKGRSFGEKLMWFCFVSIGAVSAFVIIGSLWEKFQTNPTITGLDTDSHNQEMIFPTVLVCPINPFSPEKVNETAYRNLAGYEDNYEQYVPLLEALPKLSYENFDITYETFMNTTEKIDIKKTTLRQLIFKVAIKCEELFYVCKYRDEEVSCCEIFSTVYTERGFCYSFNARYVAAPDEEIRNEHLNNLFETDKKWSLSFVLMSPSRVFLHSVEEVSGLDIRPQFMWDDGFTIDLLITMKQTYTTNDAAQLTVGQRKCIYPNEIKLKYYKADTYSLSACMKQCRMEKANRLCKCIPPFYQPASDNYRQCELSDFECLKKFNGNITDFKGCRHCELSCLNTVYDIEKLTKTLISSTKLEDFRINIEFLTWPIISYKREVLFGWVELLVSFGGIAGLFLGFSLLSGVEIIYYFTLRAGCMMFKNRQELYALEKSKQMQPLQRFDLSFGLKKPIKNRRVLSMVNVQLVKPVEQNQGVNILSVKAFDSPQVPTKSEADKNTFIISNEKIDEANARIRNLNVKYPIQQRTNIFRSIPIDPYSKHIKPLDKRFVRNRNRLLLREGQLSHDLIFDGYLP